MNDKDYLQKLEQKIDELSEKIESVLSRQDSQYSDIMRMLEEKTLLGAVEEEEIYEDSELYQKAKEEVVRAGKASVSYLQRKLKLGYARAALLIDLLEENGIIGPANGATPRKVFTKL